MYYFENSYNAFEKAIDILELGRDVKALVIGDIILDKYTYGSIECTSTGVSIPTIEIKQKKNCLGGAGNVAANLKEFVKEISIIGRIGIDSDAKEIQSLLEKYEINTESIIISEKDTMSKERVYVAEQQLYRLDNCKKENIGLNEFQQYFDDILLEFDIIVIADYDYGVCNEEVCKYIINCANKNNITTIVTSRSNIWTQYIGASYFVVNRNELLNIGASLGIDCTKDITNIGNKAVKKLLGKGILITKGEEGLVYIEKESIVKNSIDYVYPVNVSGAGDTVLAVFASSCLYEKNMEVFGTVLNIAGRIAVSSEITFVLTKDNLISECYLYNRKDDFYNKILHRECSGALIESWKKQGDSIVFTNGCFDILHPGHIKCLQEAKKCGDRLIVGINSDSSIKRIKGENRPINSESERIITLASLEMVDCLIIFDEDTAINLIKEIGPNVYVKGEEYRNKELPEAEYVEKVVYVEIIENLSTTNVIKKIVDKNW